MVLNANHRKNFSGKIAQKYIAKVMKKIDANFFSKVLLNFNANIEKTIK